METVPIDEIKVDMISVKSSNVARIGYSESAIILAIEMLDGNLYYYLDVPIEHYNELLHCNDSIPGKIKSIGSYLHRNIKGKYRYIRIK